MQGEHVQPSAVTSTSVEASIFAFYTEPQKKLLPTMLSTAEDEEEAEVAAAVDPEEEDKEELLLVPRPLQELLPLLLPHCPTTKMLQRMLEQVAVLL